MKHQLEFDIAEDRNVGLIILADSIGPEIYEWVRERMQKSGYTTSSQLTDLQKGALFLETFYYAAADIVYKLDGSFTSEERSFMHYNLIVGSMTENDEDKEKVVKDLVDIGNLISRLKQYAEKDHYKVFKNSLSTNHLIPLNKLQSYGYAMQAHANISTLEQSVSQSN
jgi:hypothetical protein